MKKDYFNGMKFNKLMVAYLGLVSVLVLAAGATFAAFTDKSSVLGSTFSVGSASIRLLEDLAGGIGAENLLEELTGPSFSEISPNWSEDYLVKVYNNSTAAINLTTNANYETANDPDDLRQVIYVEPFAWDDANNDGVVDTGELGASFGKDTIVKWKTQGFDLGLVSAGTVRSLVLRFSTDVVSDAKQGASAIFDFEFNSTGL